MLKNQRSIANETWIFRQAKLFKSPKGNHISIIKLWYGICTEKKYHYLDINRDHRLNPSVNILNFHPHINKLWFKNSRLAVITFCWCKHWNVINIAFIAWSLHILIWYINWHNSFLNFWYMISYHKKKLAKVKNFIGEIELWTIEKR